MFIKHARSKITGMVQQEAGQELAGRMALLKQAHNLQRFSYDPKQNFYLDVWAVSAYEKFGLNENDDGFEAKELQASHGSFINSWVCLDHNNSGPHLSIGSNIDSLYTPDDYVRIVMSIDRDKAERRFPGLEGKIASGSITDTSMGCLAFQSVCSIPKCANVASDESQFCNHVVSPHMGGSRGKTLCDASTNWEPVRCGELNRGVNFFEDSIITSDEGADNNAKILSRIEHEAKVASAMTGSMSIPADKLFGVLTRLASTASTVEQKAYFVTLIDTLEREL